MEEKTNRSMLKLFAGKASNGEDAFERVPVEYIAADQARLLGSPALVLGLAKNDRIKLLSQGRFKVLERGGFVSVQVHLQKSIENLNTIENWLSERLCASIDGVNPRVFSLSVPVDQGFATIEARLDELLELLPSESDWYFGNVFDEKDSKTPLNWWVSGGRAH